MFFFNSLVIKTLDQYPDPDSLEMLDPDPYPYQLNLTGTGTRVLHGASPSIIHQIHSDGAGFETRDPPDNFYFKWLPVLQAKMS